MSLLKIYIYLLIMKRENEKFAFIFKLIVKRLFIIFFRFEKGN
jgi:hypothetical protein